jgi:prepilin-type N-terminal cleavage/methylation domain-containing protein
LLEPGGREEKRLRPRSNDGFTIVEVMIVVAIAAVMVALGYPSWQRMNDNIALKAAARAVQDTFGRAREQAVRLGRRQLVFSQTPPAVDSCGLAIPSPLLVLDDANSNCCIDAGETVWVPEELSRAGVQQTAFWGVTNATVRVPEDAGTGNRTLGATFARPAGGQSPGVAFRGDGVPVTMSAACAAGNVGSGAGAYYFTNGRPGLGAAERRDLAVVLSALGTSKVYSWDAVTGRWTQ